MGLLDPLTPEQTEKLRKQREAGARGMERWNPVVIPGVVAVVWSILLAFERKNVKWTSDFSAFVYVLAFVVPWGCVAYQFGGIAAKEEADTERRRLREADERAAAPKD